MERVQTTIRLTRELKEQLEEQAEERGMTLRDVIVFILWDYVHSTSFPE
jgi:predicted DNA-binding protein